MTVQIIELWDVLVIAMWTSMQLVMGVRFTWPIVVVISCVCMRNRDLEIHECVAALYMLRHTCGAVAVPTSWLAVPVLVLGVLSRFTFYRERDALERRLYVLCSFIDQLKCKLIS